MQRHGPIELRLGHAELERDGRHLHDLGGISPELPAGRLVVPHQLIDYTWGRAQSFVISGEKQVTHLDFTEPYCRAMREDILRAAAQKQIAIRDGGVYAVAQGPRLETAAEINRFERDGADMVGMTSMPEAYLARELDICYAAIGVVVNDAAGRGASRNGIREEDIERVLDDLMSRVRALLEELVVLQHPEACAF